jgi:hypothetical protein
MSPAVLFRRAVRLLFYDAQWYHAIGFKPGEGATMDQIMTMDEIQDQFDSEWVLVEDPEVNEALEVIRGRVVYHSKDRDEVYRKAIELRPKRAAYLYTGKMPEGTAIVL